MWMETAYLSRCRSRKNVVCYRVSSLALQDGWFLNWLHGLPSGQRHWRLQEQEHCRPQRFHYVRLIANLLHLQLYILLNPQWRVCLLQSENFIVWVQLNVQPDAYKFSYNRSCLARSLFPQSVQYRHTLKSNRNDGSEHVYTSKFRNSIRVVIIHNVNCR